MEKRTVEVRVIYGGETHSSLGYDTDILPENVPKMARSLMDTLYARLDDQISTAKQRAKRRRAKAKKRAGNNGKIVPDGGEEAGE